MQLFASSAVVDDRAGAAVAGVAADVRAGQVEVVAEEVHEQPAGLDVVLDLLAVDVTVMRLLVTGSISAAPSLRGRRARRAPRRGAAGTRPTRARRRADRASRRALRRPRARSRRRSRSRSRSSISRARTGTASTQPIAMRAPPFSDAAAVTMPVPSLPIVTAAKPSWPPGGIVIFVSSSPGPAAVM